MENPIKKRINELGISIRAAARIVELAQPVVLRHYHGTQRPSFDSMEVYHGRLGIPLTDLRAWAKHLREQNTCVSSTKQ